MKASENTAPPVDDRVTWPAPLVSTFVPDWYCVASDQTSCPSPPDQSVCVQSTVAAAADGATKPTSDVANARATKRRKGAIAGAEADKLHIWIPHEKDHTHPDWANRTYPGSAAVNHGATTRSRPEPSEASASSSAASCAPWASLPSA